MSMIIPRQRIEYIAPFFKNRYFFILVILLTVICLTAIAPRAFPTRMSGTDIVKANAPSTPSIEENVASMTSELLGFY